MSDFEKKSKIKQLFCKHDYHECRKKEPFQCLSGESIYIVCEKCGKVKGSYFKKYD